MAAAAKSPGSIAQMLLLRRMDLAFSLCNVRPRVWWKCDRVVFLSSPDTVVLFLASSERTRSAEGAHPPPAASITMGMKVMP